jgi:hypothetical protein
MTSADGHVALPSGHQFKALEFRSFEATALEFRLGAYLIAPARHCVNAQRLPATQTIIAKALEVNPQLSQT